MYELNPNLKIVTETFKDSVIYTIDDFFLDPNKIIDYMKTAPHYEWQGFSSPRHNGTNYKYKKIFDIDDRIKNVDHLMMPYFQKGELQIKGFVLSDFFLVDREYNDYKNKYFWPHKDFGWTGVVFLNHYEGPGTNLYTELETVIKDNALVKNSQNAWFDKKMYSLDKVLYSKFNRCIFFDAFKFNHNIAIDDDSWFNEHRLNVVIHYKHEEVKFYNHGI